ncbi:MAG: NAD(+)--dinitrogen-reductase ADP-D-ribosyltransferase [Sedimenticolaceae bacterium]
MNEHTNDGEMAAALPKFARLPINRCNLPPQILGSLTFQRHPTALCLDGVEALHGRFFAELDGIDDALQRAAAFNALMQAAFVLDALDEAGLENRAQRVRRGNADYLRLLRGWMFDADGQEAAVLKSWVESRFGLVSLSHRGSIRDTGSAQYQRYLAARAQGLYNTNALEAQLDLLYSYCQYELARRLPQQQHLTLYRGTNRIEEYDVLAKPAPHRWIMVLNNLNSFSDDPERADEFGDIVLLARVPKAKVLFMPGLLPGTLRGEQEYLVIGGVYETRRNRPGII